MGVILYHLEAKTFSNLSFNWVFANAENLGVSLVQVDPLQPNLQLSFRSFESREAYTSSVAILVMTPRTAGRIKQQRQLTYNFSRYDHYLDVESDGVRNYKT